MLIKFEQKQVIELEVEVPFYSKFVPGFFYRVTDEGVTTLRDADYEQAVVFNNSKSFMYPQTVNHANTCERISEEEFLQAFNDLNLKLTENILQPF